MAEITIITAFFDIGRKDFKRIPRSNEKYFSYFEVWARMKNKVICYVGDNAHAERVRQIRARFGNEQLTKVIVIDDVFLIEQELYQEMEKVSGSKHFIDFRIYPDDTSNIAKYDFIMLSKTYFLAHAVKTFNINGMIAWLDFGFGQGNIFVNPEEFETVWQYDFEPKIHLWHLEPYDARPIFEIVRDCNDCIMGGVFILPADLSAEFYALCRKQMQSLVKIGFIDDDQLIMLMAYREKPELFVMQKSDWFLPVIENGLPKLKLRERKVRHSFAKKYAIKVYLGLLKRRVALRNAFNLYKNLMGGG